MGKILSFSMNRYSVYICILFHLSIVMSFARFLPFRLLPRTCLPIPVPVACMPSDARMSSTSSGSSAGRQTSSRRVLRRGSTISLSVCAGIIRSESPNCRADFPRAALLNKFTGDYKCAHLRLRIPDFAENHVDRFACHPALADFICGKRLSQFSI